ncbi:peroxide stress protein YaaA [Rhodobacter sp. CZR27]|uniref:peroxide stress protein YaaA n=1 Tax=Rhodobacter sp. CZR27 TaxID=2033869 RepID=UPI000BBEB30C|nr:peroxide stress protein YaaA [Rhodobacter sp. CZR27]
MLVVLSPAKRLAARPALALPEGMEPGRPRFQPEADELAKVAHGLTAADLRRLMHISEPLARLNVARFAAFHEARDEAVPALALFDGDTYAGLEARTLDADALRWVQGRVCILSGLYGLLRPLDLIQPHRLEMGTRLATARGATLYDYWGDRIARALNEQSEETGARTLVNCASVEYFTAVDRAALRLPVISPVFLEDRAGEQKIVSFWAKRARGAMARFIAENRLTDPEAILSFRAGGYVWEPELSTPERPVFLRAS